MTASKVALITGAAQRVGAVIAQQLHDRGVSVAIHYHRSEQAATALVQRLNVLRPNSALCLQYDLLDNSSPVRLVEQVQQHWQRLDMLVNNASSFYPTPFGNISQHDWHNLLGSNLKAPFFLAQAAATHLRQHQGTIINLVDVHAQRPLKNYSLYCIAKAGLVTLTQSLAKELGPDIRVNGVAPGAVLWPENFDHATRVDVLQRTALRRAGTPEDVAQTVVFLALDAPYITGQIITVDGGRSLNQ